MEALLINSLPYKTAVQNLVGNIKKLGNLKNKNKDRGGGELCNPASKT